MVTRDRLIAWGLQVPSVCILCNASDENRQHLFFDCPYSSTVWSFFCNRLHLSPPPLFEDGLRWLKDPIGDKNLVLIIRLLFQASIYHIWMERNSRLHRGIARQAELVVADIKQTILLRLDPLSETKCSSWILSTLVMVPSILTPFWTRRKYFL